MNNMDLEDVSWVIRLIEWADKNNIPELQWHDDEDNPEIEGFWLGFPRDIEAVINLTHLNLSWHDLNELPEELGNLTKLEALIVDKRADGLQPDWEPLTENVLSEIPDWVTTLPNLKELSLAQNAIRALPESIGNLSNLEVLYLPGNHIYSIPSSLYKLKNLKRLFLFDNEILDLPRGLSKLMSLDTLCLNHNQLAECAEEICDLPLLTTLTFTTPQSHLN